MRLCVGSIVYDLTSRALVMGTVDRARSAIDLVGDGADLVEVGAPGQVAAASAAGVPVCLTTDCPDLAEAGFRAGASMVRGPVVLASLCVGRGATLVVKGQGAAREAEADGVARDRLVVEAAAAGRLSPGPGEGYHLLVDVVGAPCPTAAAAVAVLGGCRMVRASDVRAARRISDTLAAVMEAE